jgi:hypothetical protein
MDPENDNGAPVKPEDVSQIVLTLDRKHFLLAITGNTENYDEAIAILGMALRDFENRLRAATASQVLRAPLGAMPTRPFRARG